MIGVVACTKESVTLNVAAASSLTDVLEEINDLYKQHNPQVTITANYASSGTLQQQIEQGGLVDVFISAGASQVDTLQNGQLIWNVTRKDLLKNKIVLIVPNDSTLGLTDFNGLTGTNVDKIAIGAPDSVPAGKYAKLALEQLGIYDELESKLILCANVRQVLTYVENSDVDAGIVYITDALVSNKVKVVAEGPAEVNAKIVYPVAVIKAGQNPDAALDYEDFLFSDEAKAIFVEYGFVPIED